MTKPFVSVIIPVRNDNPGLDTCLKALSLQTYPSHKYEIIVVDNNSDRIPDFIVEKHKNVSLAVEARKGSYAARNKGIFLARGDIIALTDSDCIPAPDWIEKGVDLLNDNEDYGIVGGRVNVFPINKGKLTAVEMWDLLFSFNQKRHVEEGRFAVTANLFTGKDVFNKVGRFDESLFSCGDQEWGRRVFSYGFKIIYGSDVIISHPARCSIEQFYRKEARIISGTYELESMSGYPWLKHVASLVRDLIPPFEGLYAILLNKRFRSLNEMAGLAGVELYHWYLWVYERMRLMAGGTPRY